MVYAHSRNCCLANVNSLLLCCCAAPVLLSTTVDDTQFIGSAANTDACYPTARAEARAQALADGDSSARAEAKAEAEAAAKCGRGGRTRADASDKVVAESSGDWDRKLLAGELFDGNSSQVDATRLQRTQFRSSLRSVWDASAEQWLSAANAAFVNFATA